MGIATEKYIRKPLYVDAIRVTPENFDEVVAWCQGEAQVEEIPSSGTTKKYIKIRVHNPKNPRQTKAFIGDWVLYTERGYKVYTTKAFRAAFDKVDDEGKAKPKPRDETPRPKGNVGAQVTITDKTPKPVVETPTEKIAKELEGETTPEGEPIEVVPATPEAIAEAVNEQQPIEMTEDEARAMVDLPPKEPTPELVESVQDTVQEVAEKLDKPVNEVTADEIVEHVPITEQPPDIAAAGKAVLSQEEQSRMGPEKVRELLQSGEYILAQDLAEAH
jgi:hypothetical protein